eukprot:NODE_8874_length_637_cov_41.470817_g8249_i0.p1 GENE.NODE_8874_length_637_cov_41.470817_g8249_i0~~NODE_8874_length_637_cov_41.470817_g8249_i0.p1  ORF type:complete len:188 (+),score=27.42 NODE_8874_length_637_cov_41.470817_g8249_i0:80-565(+)
MPSRSRSRSPRDKVRKKDLTTLFVGNLPFDMEKRELWDELDPVGKIREITLPKDPGSGKPRGFAFVEFETHKDASRAFNEFQNKKVLGRQLRLDWDEGIDNKRATGKLGLALGGATNGRRHSWSSSSSPRRSRSNRRSRSPKRRTRRSRSPPAKRRRSYSR